MIFQHSIVPAIILWVLVIIYYFSKHRAWKFKKFKFSPEHYYIMMSPLLAGLAINSWQTRSIKPLVLFIIFAFAGIIGEALADKWWQTFYAKSLWVYNVETVFHRYTSWLNFLPWALGGFLYLNVSKQVAGDQVFPSILPVSITILSTAILLQIFLFNLIKPTTRFKYQQATWVSLLIVYSPIIFFICMMASIFGPVIYQLALWFAIVGTIAEYLFGKACHVFISKKLWDYTYWSVDQDHFTLLSIPLFCIGGFYFWIISLAVTKYLFN